MRPRLLPSWLLPAMVMAVAAAPAAAAAGLSADEVRGQGDLTVDGILELLHIDSPGSAVVELSLSGDLVSATQYTYTEYALDAVAYQHHERTVPTATGEGPTRSSWQGQDAEATLAGLGDAAKVHAYGGPSMRLQADDARWVPILHPQLHDRGIDSIPPGQHDPERPYFNVVSAPGQHVLGELGGVALHLELEGTFVLELQGLDLRFSAPGRSDATYTSQRTEQVLVPGVTGPALAKVHDEFVRVRVTDGQLTLRVLGGDTRALWVDRDTAAVAAADGMLELDGARGSLATDGEMLQPRQGELRLPAPAAIALAPGRDTIDVTWQPVAQPKGTGVFASDELLGSWWLPGLLLALAILAVAGWLAARSRIDLATVEAALAAGRFQHAASLAGRLLKKHPNLEDAAIARAVALTRGGQSARVVAEVGRRLRERPPSDGVLHYVLGLAYLDLGRRTEAHDALAEAVRRTPSLADDVAARLGGQATEPAREATAYA